MSSDAGLGITLRMKKPAAPKNHNIFKQITPQELRKGDLRKLQIVQAAIDCISEKGWVGTNYESVGQYCQIKRQHVAYHYPNWDDLIEATMKFVYATGSSVVSDYIREAKDGKSQLAAYIEGTFHWIASHPKHASTISLLWHLATFEKKYRALYSDLKQLGTQRIYSMLYGDKSANPSSPQWIAALGIHGLVVGRCIEFFSSEQESDWQEISKQVFEQALRIAQVRMKST